MRTIKELINDLYRLADVDCGIRDDEDHDYDNCKYCDARHTLNEIGDISRTYFKHWIIEI